MSFPKLNVLILAFLFCAGCVTPAPPPVAQESKLFHTVEYGFHISAREGIIRYSVLLELKAPLDQPLFITVSYENPADPAAPHMEKLVWPIGEDLLQLASPPLRELESGKRYRIEMTVFEDPARTRSVDTHEIFILSNIDNRGFDR